MKPDTQARDILAHIAARTAKAANDNARAHAIAHVDALAARTAPTSPAPDPLAQYIAAAQASRDAAQALAKVPRPRREVAASAVTFAEQHARDAARRMGGYYSGVTSYAVRWHDTPQPATASTSMDKGGQYSRRCMYSKTDALHGVTLDPSGVSLLASSPLVALSARDGLPLVSLKPDGSAVWIVSKAKQIKAQAGWIIGDAQICYHSTKSREHAVKGYEAKRRAYEAEQAARAERERAHRASPEYKAERRARLVARLCSGLTATIADARAAGYCTPGIEQFQRQHAIGDAATLPDLCRTKNPLAVSLALRIARQNLKAA